MGFIFFFHSYSSSPPSPSISRLQVSLVSVRTGTDSVFEMSFVDWVIYYKV